MRQPKRLIVRGDDEKEYKFLVKGGEDLRMDQRIEQVLKSFFSFLFNVDHYPTIYYPIAS